MGNRGLEGIAAEEPCWNQQCKGVGEQPLWPQLHGRGACVWLPAQCCPQAGPRSSREGAGVAFAALRWGRGGCRGQPPAPAEVGRCVALPGSLPCSCSATARRLGGGGCCARAPALVLLFASSSCCWTLTPARTNPAPRGSSDVHNQGPKHRRMALRKFVFQRPAPARQQL